MFYFNSDKFDFWKIYDAIKRYYPIGVSKIDSKFFFSYPGLKELENIVVDNIQDGNHFEERWESFTRSIGKEIGKETSGTTYGQAPSFSSCVVLDTSSNDNLTRTKELHFFVSLVGPFFTVIGRDNVTVKLDDGARYTTANYLVVSPENEYADAFKFLCEKIGERFKGFRFVPFQICQQTIEGLSVRYSDDTLNSVFHALFNDQIDLVNCRKIGNDYYKSEDWIREGYANNGEVWTAYPPVSSPLFPNIEAEK